MADEPDTMAAATETADAAADGEEQIRSHEQAETFEMPDEEAPVGVPASLGSIVGAVGTINRPAQSQPEPVLRTLEDLYDRHPALGGGDYKMYVSRKKPSALNGMPIAGYLGEYTERMTTTGFKDKFGGGTYEVTVLKPVADGTTGETGYRSVDKVQIKMAGAPTGEGIEEMGRQGNAFGQQMYPPVQTVPVGEPAAVQVERLKGEREERQADRHERQKWQERAAQGPADAARAVHEVIGRSHQAAVENIQNTNAEAITWLQRETQRLHDEINRRDETLAATRAELVEAQKSAADVSFRAETKAIRDLERRHDEDRRRLVEDHATRVTDLSAQYTAQITQLKEAHDRERRDYESTQSREREKLREDSNRVREETRQRITEVERATERELKALREEQRVRIDDIRRDAEKEIQRAREMFELQLGTVRESERTQATLTTKTNEYQMSVMDAELSRARHEHEQERTRANELRDRVYKEPEEAIESARRLAALGGMVDASEQSADAEKESTIEKLLGLGQTVLEKAPNLVEQIRDGRKDSMHHQQAMAQHQAMHQRAAAMQQGMRPVAHLPAPAGQASPQPMAPAAAPAVAGAPYAGSVAPIQPMAEHPAAAVPLGGGGVEVPAPAPMAAPVVGQPQQVEVAQQPSPPPVSQEAMGQFLNALEQAIASRAIDPAGFAEGFVARVGIEATAQLLDRYQPEHFIDAVRASPGGESAAITTHSGSRFVHEVWAEAAQLVQAQLAQQVVAAPPAQVVMAPAQAAVAPPVQPPAQAAVAPPVQVVAAPPVQAVPPSNPTGPPPDEAAEEEDEEPADE
jgi:hypothetical protein